MSWTSLCELTDLHEGQGSFVEISGFQLAMFRQGEAVYVMDNYCPHAGGNLAGGHVENGCAICPWHQWAFRLENGQLRDAPGVAIRTYPTRVLEHQGKRLVQVDLPMY